jgi:hypothetical protein
METRRKQNVVGFSSEEEGRILCLMCSEKYASNETPG